MSEAITISCTGHEVLAGDIIVEPDRIITVETVERDSGVVTTIRGRVCTMHSDGWGPHVLNQVLFCGNDATYGHVVRITDLHDASEVEA